MATNPIRYSYKIISHLVRLPKYIRYFEESGKTTDARVGDLEFHLKRIETLQSEITKQSELALKKFQSTDTFDDRLADIEHKLSSHSPTKAMEQKVVNDTVADNHAYDNFYKKFEDKFRGSEESIKQRVSEHLPRFKKMPAKLKKKPVIDIGCGRGEFISVLSDAGFDAIGVDMNEKMVERAINMGLKAVTNDAKSYLSEYKSGSVAAITGFHIVEHIPFESLMEIFKECYRALDRGGFVLFETPNPQSLFVGANTFYLDPSHQRPVPSELLAFMLEYVGFGTEIVPLHPIKVDEQSTDKTLSSLQHAIYGDADYAVIGTKL